MHNQFDFEGLANEIEIAIKCYCNEMKQHELAADFYGFALYSDEGAMTVCPACNTLTYLHNMQSEDSEDGAYYRFSPAEWQFEGESVFKDGYSNQLFGAICTKVRKAVLEGEDDDDWFAQFQQSLYACCENVLARLQAQHFFTENFGEHFLLMFSVSDGDIDKKEAIRMMTRLNVPSLVDAYRLWTKSW